MTRRNNNPSAQGGRSIFDDASRIFEGDRTMWIIYAVLIILSILVVYSSTAKMAYDITSKMSTTDALRTQLMFVLMSIPLIYFIHKMDFHTFRRYTPVLYYLFVALTVAAYLFGSTTNGAARWLPIGPFQFQPSEGLKIMTILMLAKCMEPRQLDINKIHLLPTSFKLGDPAQKRIIRENTIPLLGPVMLSCGVILPAHTSSAIIIMGASIIMLYIGRVSIKEITKFIVVMCAVGGLCLGVLGLGRGDTAGGRLKAWTKEWTTDGKCQSMADMSDTQRAMVAIRNGGLFGEGAGHSTSRVVVVHPESDYAYAFFVSEYGIITALLLMLLYLWIFFRSIEICRQCHTAFSMLATAGLGLLITIQALLHILVQINIIPETGQTLPLISRGGTSMLFTSIAIGIIISISRTNALAEQREAEKRQNAKSNDNE